MNIQAGAQVPVHIEVAMDNPAGLFQVEKLLAHKLTLTGLSRYVSLRACVVPQQGETEPAFHCLVLHEGRFQPETTRAPTDTAWPVDPVCGMGVAPEEAAGSVVYGGRRYVFCSTTCFTSFQYDPFSYVPQEAP